MRIATVVLTAAFLFGAATHAKAAEISYTFTGSGDYLLNGQSFSGAFTANLIGDTTTVFNDGTGRLSDAAISASFALENGSVTANFASASLLEIQGGDFPNIGFVQTQPAPVFAVNEAINSAAFNAYNLKTNFAPTSGNVSFIPQTYVTSLGNLEFTSISSLSFEAATFAEVSAVPLPSSLSLFALALASLLGVGYARRRA